MAIGGLASISPNQPGEKAADVSRRPLGEVAKMKESLNMAKSKTMFGENGISISLNISENQWRRKYPPSSGIGVAPLSSAKMVSMAYPSISSMRIQSSEETKLEAASSAIVCGVMAAMAAWRRPHQQLVAHQWRLSVVL
jgi:hypothetical protein